MGRMPWAVYLWPGLPHIWKRGVWFGLAVAVGFAVLLNLALAGSLVWTELELLSAVGRSYIWLAVAIIWIGSAAFSFVWDHRRDNPCHAETENDSFGEALDQYLQQNWYEAERSLNNLLRRNPRDIDARLLLVSVLRRAGRLREATGALERLSRLEESRKWELEIDQERRWLTEAVRPTENEEAASEPSPNGERVAA
ncbi:MAG: hypothetical protein JW888_09695 [Pirellulales bacterium]|nr:hypothetical protein [Pirellulales bacterium]